MNIKKFLSYSIILSCLGSAALGSPLSLVVKNNLAMPVTARFLEAQDNAQGGNKTGGVNHWNQGTFLPVPTNIPGGQSSFNGTKTMPQGANSKFALLATTKAYEHAIFIGTSDANGTMKSPSNFTWWLGDGSLYGYADNKTSPTKLTINRISLSAQSNTNQFQCGLNQKLTNYAEEIGSYRLGSQSDHLNNQLYRKILQSESSATDTVNARIYKISLSTLNWCQDLVGPYYDDSTTQVYRMRPNVNNILTHFTSVFHGYYIYGISSGTNPKATLIGTFLPPSRSLVGQSMDRQFQYPTAKKWLWTAPDYINYAIGESQFYFQNYYDTTAKKSLIYNKLVIYAWIGNLPKPQASQLPNPIKISSLSQDPNGYNYTSINLDTPTPHTIWQGKTDIPKKSQIASIQLVTPNNDNTVSIENNGMEQMPLTPEITLSNASYGGFSGCNGIIGHTWDANDSCKNLGKTATPPSVFGESLEWLYGALYFKNNSGQIITNYLNASHSNTPDFLDITQNVDASKNLYPNTTIGLYGYFAQPRSGNQLNTKVSSNLDFEVSTIGSGNPISFQPYINLPNTQAAKSANTETKVIPQAHVPVTSLQGVSITEPTNQSKSTKLQLSLSFNRALPTQTTFDSQYDWLRGSPLQQCETSTCKKVISNDMVDARQEYRYNNGIVISTGIAPIMYFLDNNDKQLNLFNYAVLGHGSATSPSATTNAYNLPIIGYPILSLQTLKAEAENHSADNSELARIAATCKNQSLYCYAQFFKVAVTLVDSTGNVYSYPAPVTN